MIYMTHVTSCHLSVPVLLWDGVSPREYRGFESLWAADIDTRHRPIRTQYSGHVTCLNQSQASIQVTWSQGKGVSRRSVGRSPGKHLISWLLANRHTETLPHRDCSWCCDRENSHLEYRFHLPHQNYVQKDIYFLFHWSVKLQIPNTVWYHNVLKMSLPRSLSTPGRNSYGISELPLILYFILL